MAEGSSSAEGAAGSAAQKTQGAILTPVYDKLANAPEPSDNEKIWAALGMKEGERDTARGKGCKGLVLQIYAVENKNLRTLYEFMKGFIQGQQDPDNEALPPATTYHASRDGHTANSILDIGFRGSCGERKQIGAGIYAAYSIIDTFQYGRTLVHKTDDGRIIIHWVTLQLETVLGNVAEGSPNLIDFGVTANGERVHTTTDKSQKMVCTHYDAQHLAQRKIIMGFDPNEEQSEWTLAFAVQAMLARGDFWIAKFFLYTPNWTKLQEVPWFKKIAPIINHPDLLQNEEPKPECSGLLSNPKQTPGFKGTISWSKLLQQRNANAAAAAAAASSAGTLSGTEKQLVAAAMRNAFPLGGSNSTAAASSAGTPSATQKQLVPAAMRNAPPLGGSNSTAAASRTRKSPAATLPTLPSDNAMVKKADDDDRDAWLNGNQLFFKFYEEIEPYKLIGKDGQLCGRWAQGRVSWYALRIKNSPGVDAQEWQRKIEQCNKKVLDKQFVNWPYGCMVCRATQLYFVDKARELKRKRAAASGAGSGDAEGAAGKKPKY